MVSRDTKLAQQELMDILAGFYWKPLDYVMFAFPWDTEPSIQIVELQEPWKSRYPGCIYGPDVWACEFFDELGAEILDRGFDGRNPIDFPIQFSTVSGHGIGKSATTAQLIKFLADTRPHSKGIVTAATQDQLKTKTWAELGKWHRLSVTRHLFDYSAGRGSMSLKHRLFPETWRCDAQTSKEENSESFAGLHAVNSTPYYVFDEASGVPDKINEVAQGGLTDGEAMFFAFGNGTQNSGWFFESQEGKTMKYFNRRQIDSRSVKITNKRLFQRWADDYGEDSDFFRVRVRGQFPKSGVMEFIGRDDWKAAKMRELVPVTPQDPLVMGVDVARYGDDESVIYIRHGMDARSWEPRRFRGLNTVQLAGKIIEIIREFRGLGQEFAAIFVDGTGVGGGVVDQLTTLGYQVIEVQFGNSATDAKQYRYVTDEMWGNLRIAMRNRLCLPADTDLESQLTQRQYGINLKGQIQLESKKDMKKRLGADSSPDIADALALTFYMEVAPREVPDDEGGAKWAKHEFDPLAEAA